jgi:hypothetical protein
MTKAIWIDGDKQVKDTLEALGKQVTKRLAGKAAKETMNQEPLQAAKQNARSMVGGKMGDLLSRFLTVRVWGKRGKKGASVQIDETANDIFVEYSSGSSSDINTKKTSGKRYYIPYAIEYGHAFPYKGGSGNKDVKPIPFMRTAFESSKGGIIGGFKKRIVDEIEKFVKKREKANAKASAFSESMFK